ncbi:MAG: alkaline phosphatase PhoX [Coleofasciculaceae cyanobacterium]
MSKFTRRQLLIFFGSSAAATVLTPKVGQKLMGSSSSAAQAQALESLSFTPIRLPHPLPIYQTKQSFMPTGIDQRTIMEPAADPILNSYTIVDDVVVPPQYERYVIAAWGDRIFPNQSDYFGYNNDFTAFTPLNGSLNDGYLWVNHEYVSFPISDLAPGTPPDLVGTPTTFEEVIGYPLPATLDPAAGGIETRGEFYYNVGGSVIRLTRPNRSGRFQVNVNDPNNRRIHGLSGLGINAERTDGFQTVTAWGARPHQIGDQNYLVGTGPAATEVFNLSSDGLGNRIIGTGFNCSGGDTPWGTILTAEENFQGSATFFVGVAEGVLPNGTQVGYVPETNGAVFGQVGEKYGWMVEIDPADPTVRPKKHTALGRFRHENVAFRLQPGQPLIAYMGDDKRGGHTWKYVSNGVLGPLNDKANSALFEDGTLYVAKYNADGTGEWLPLVLTAATNPIPPSVLASVEIAALGSAARDGGTRLPQRAGLAGATVDGGSIVVTTADEATILPAYQNKTLADLYTSQGAVLVDSFLAANSIGGTPTARPEDVEVHPRTKEVFIAYTDHIPGGDGYPDSRIFQTAKLSADVNAQQPSGALFKIIENSQNGAGTSFRWTKLVQAGEAGAVEGDGFANVDNLAFDSQANVWGVTDMSTSRQNGFRTGAAPGERTIDHTATGSTDALVGVFGNNWLFYVPTSGPDAGAVVPFAYGPPRCEMTGPTFVGDTLILTVQHPGEDVPRSNPTLLSRQIEMLKLDGTLFNQTRNVPLGSSWPSNIGYPLPNGTAGTPAGPPRPSVIAIRPKVSRGQFV